MATYYVELNGGDIAPKTELVGGVITPSVSFSGAQIYPTSGGGGTVTLQTKSVTYTPSTSQQTEQVTPDQGYDGLDEVNVTVDAVASGSVVVDDKSITISSPFSFNATTGKISSHILNSYTATATVTDGYVSSATSGNIHVYTNKDQQLDTVGATTYYPSTSDQTIATQQYLTGAQTFKGVTYSGLDAGNIKKDVVVKIGDSADDDRILSVTGTYEGGGGGLPSYYSDLVEGTLNGDFTFPETTAARAFSNITGTFTLNLPNLTSLKGNNGFENSKFTSLYAPLLTDTKSSMCSGCTEVVTIFVPSAKLGTNCFNGCSKVQTVVFGAMGSNYQQMRNCPLLKTVDCGASTGKMDNVWQVNCGSFDTFIIRGDTVLALHNTTAFDSTKFANGGAGGTVYIPESLYDHLGDGTSYDYQSATNWSTVYARGTITWAKIEGSAYDGYYADGTPIS